MNAISRRYSSAFVTGASAGLGQAFAQMLLNEGVPVWGTARDVRRLEQFRDRPDFHPVLMDLTDAEATLDAFEEAEAVAGGFDLVINNAGYGLFAAFGSVPFIGWEEQVEAMLMQPMRLAHRALEGFERKHHGTLVNVASLAVEFPLPYMSGYNVVKAGLAALSESLQIETRGTDVTVIDFRPGDYRTGFNRSMSHATPSAASAVASPATQGRAWQVLEQNLAAAPDAMRAAHDLRRALEQGRRGIVRSGSFFQAKFAPVAVRLLPESWARSLRWRYFGLT